MTYVTVWRVIDSTFPYSGTGRVSLGEENNIANIAEYTYVSAVVFLAAKLYSTW